MQYPRLLHCLGRAARARHATNVDASIARVFANGDRWNLVAQSTLYVADASGSGVARSDARHRRLRRTRSSIRQCLSKRVGYEGADRQSCGRGCPSRTSRSGRVAAASGCRLTALPAERTYSPSTRCPTSRSHEARCNPHQYGPRCTRGSRCAGRGTACRSLGWSSH